MAEQPSSRDRVVVPRRSPSGGHGRRAPGHDSPSPTYTEHGNSLNEGRATPATSQRRATHRAFTVIRGGDAGDFWIGIGSMSRLEHNEGFELKLVCFPDDGMIVCLPVTAGNNVVYPKGSRPRNRVGRRSAKRR